MAFDNSETRGGNCWGSQGSRSSPPRVGPEVMPQTVAASGSHPGMDLPIPSTRKVPCTGLGASMGQANEPKITEPDLERIRTQYLIYSIHWLEAPG